MRVYKVYFMKQIQSSSCLSTMFVAGRNNIKVYLTYSYVSFSWPLFYLPLFPPPNFIFLLSTSHLHFVPLLSSRVYLACSYYPFLFLRRTLAPYLYPLSSHLVREVWLNFFSAKNVSTKWICRNIAFQEPISFFSFY